MTDTLENSHASDSNPDNYPSDDDSSDQEELDLAFCVTCNEHVPWSECHSGIGPDKVSVCNDCLRERNPNLSPHLMCLAHEHFPTDFLVDQLEAQAQEIARMIEALKQSEKVWQELDPEIKREAQELGYI